ncbi:MAG: hypothetical protein ACTHJM_01330 [Marmoricola sp.]
MTGRRRGAGVVVLGGALSLVLAGCGGSNDTSPSAHHSATARDGKHVVIDRMRAFRSFAEVRATSTAVVMGIAGVPVTELVRSGLFKDIPVVRTPFTVTKVVWGKLSRSTVTVSQLQEDDPRDAPLVEGQRYLLFVRPADIEPAPDRYGIMGPVSYRLAGDAWVYNGKLDDKLPASMPVSAAEKQVRS